MGSIVHENHRQLVATISLFAIVLSQLFACSSSKEVATKGFKSTRPPTLLTPTASVVRADNSDLRFLLTIRCEGKDGSTDLATARGIYQILLIPRTGKDHKPIDTLVAQIASEGGAVDDTTEFIQLDVNQYWENADSIEIEKVVIEYILVNTKREETSYVREFIIPPAAPQRSDDPVRMTPFLENVTDTSILFGVIAERLSSVPAEYLPSSEMFRVEIINGKGQVVWASNFRKNYLTIVGSVEPKAKGAFHRYEMPWNGKSNDGTPLAPGVYTIRFIIPAKPNNYMYETEFKWLDPADK